jgi:hypothetical protein
MEFGEEYLMCEHAIEQKHKKEAKKQIESIPDLLHEIPYSIKIEVKSRGIEVLIHTVDECDALEISGAVIRHLRMMGTEPKGVVLP